MAYVAASQLMPGPRPMVLEEVARCAKKGYYAFI